ncbi:MAG: hypothetical protein LAO20_01945 [Acidobacteriia bacterium]|nr:hypothetical protein [Terriglobia bacterium]
MLSARPAAYAVVAILPYVVAIGLLVLIGRMIHLKPAVHESWDPVSLWKSMGWGERLLIVLAFIASATVPSYLAARGVCRMALEQQKDVRIPLGKVLLDMLRFIPTAVLYFAMIGIPSYLGGWCFVVPGLLITTACALIVPAGIDGQLGPLAAIRRGFSLIKRVFGRVLAVYVCFLIFVILGQVVASNVAGVVAAQSDSPAAMFSALGVWFLITQVAMALVNIMVTLFYCEARDMGAPPLVPAVPGVTGGPPG